MQKYMHKSSDSHLL